MRDNESSIVLYTAPDGKTQIDVKLEGETVWLTQQQMAVLFSTERTSILRHIANIYKTSELEESVTCAKIAQVRLEGKREVSREMRYYNLDMIISVGYRVNSKKATKFRRWATSVLKNYLVKGYALNDRIRLERYEELKGVVRLMARTLESQQLLPTDEAEGLFRMVQDYVYALDTLDRYDYQALAVDRTTQEESFHATYDNAMETINRLKEKFGGSALFANEKDESFKGCSIN